MEKSSVCLGSKRRDVKSIRSHEISSRGREKETKTKRVQYHVSVLLQPNPTVRYIFYPFDASPTARYSARFLHAPPSPFPTATPSNVITKTPTSSPLNLFIYWIYFTFIDIVWYLLKLFLNTLFTEIFNWSWNFVIFICDLLFDSFWFC